MNKKFNKIFNENYTDIYFSPGRVNLIGEHIDYNGGNVLPMAITFGTYGWVKKRNDNKVRVYSENFEDIGMITYDIDNLIYKEEDDWANYTKGVISIFKQEGFNINFGFDLLIKGTIPNGSGLSSSASLELLIAKIIKDYNNLNIDDIQMATLCQKAENEFIGVNCGIMDQFIIATAKENYASLINTETLKYEFIKADFQKYNLVVINSKKKRGLVDSEYNNRRKTCESVLKKAQEIFKVNNLCELNNEQLKQLNLTSEEKQRAEHVIGENNRVKESLDLLNNNKIEQFGNLLYESYYSLRDLYEVSCDELDYIVDFCKHNNSIGARMTGAGFGGCAIAFFTDDQIKVLDELKQKYQEKFDLDLEYYVVKSSDKTKKIEEKMKVLIIGGAGYIGSHQVKMFCNLGYEVVVVDNLSTGKEYAIDRRAKFIKGDIRDYNFIYNVLKDENIEGIIHFAALSLVGVSVKEPLEYYDNNVYGMQVLLNAMKDAGVDKIVFSSTAATYGDIKEMPIKEGAEEKPINPYGETKLAMEKMMKWAHKAHNIKYVSLRYFNAAGASLDSTIGENHEPETHLIPLVLQVALSKREYISVYGDDYDTPDGTCLRDYIHVDDLCQAHLLALIDLDNGGQSDIYNLGYGHGYSVLEIIKTASKVIGKDLNYKIEKRRAGDPAKLIASNSKIKEKLNWTPKYDNLELIIKSAYDYYKKKEQNEGD